jgi:hypothetical protein
LRETDARPIRLKPDSAPALFASHSASSEPPLFTSTIDEPPRHSGLSVWFAAAGSLVLGIVIGFASGYRVGQDAAPTAAEPAAAEGEPDQARPTSGGSGQPFSESAVSEPVRIEPDPVVAAPDVPAPPRQPQAAAAPAAASPLTPATGPGSLQVVSRPAGAQVFLDGRAVGRTPLLISEVGAGQHNVRLELPGFNRWATTVDVQAGSPIRVAASLEQ